MFSSSLPFNVKEIILYLLLDNSLTNLTNIQKHSNQLMWGEECLFPLSLFFALEFIKVNGFTIEVILDREYLSVSRKVVHWKKTNKVLYILTSSPTTIVILSAIWRLKLLLHRIHFLFYSIISQFYILILYFLKGKQQSLIYNGDNTPSRDLSFL